SGDGRRTATRPPGERRRRRGGRIRPVARPAELLHLLVVWGLRQGGARSGRRRGAPRREPADGGSRAGRSATRAAARGPGDVQRLQRGVARPGLTGVLLVGGASTRFGSPKALARFGGETLAERGWRTLGETCEHRLAVGKAVELLALPFPVLDDGSDVQAPIVGLIAGLEAAPTELCVVLPVDCPRVTPALLLELADACR